MQSDDSIILFIHRSQRVWLNIQVNQHFQYFSCLPKAVILLSGQARVRRASVSKCHHGTFSNSSFYLQVALSLHSPSSCFLLLYTLLPYSPHLIIPLYPLSLFLIPGDLPSANKQPPLHPTMPYTGTQRRLISQFVDCTQARDSVAAKACLHPFIFLMR